MLVFPALGPSEARDSTLGLHTPEGQPVTGLDANIKIKKFRSFEKPGKLIPILSGISSFIYFYIQPTFLNSCKRQAACSWAGHLRSEPCEEVALETRMGDALCVRKSRARVRQGEDPAKREPP